METLPDGGLLIGGSWKSSPAASSVVGASPVQAARPRRRSRAVTRRPSSVDVFTGGVVRVYGGDFSGSPVAISVRWSRCASTCEGTGRTGWSYTLSDADAGFRLRAELVGFERRGRLRSAVEFARPGRAGLAAGGGVSGVRLHVRRPARRPDDHRRPGLLGAGPDVLPLRLAPLRRAVLQLLSDRRTLAADLHADQHRRRLVPPRRGHRRQRRGREVLHGRQRHRPDPLRPCVRHPLRPVALNALRDQGRRVHLGQRPHRKPRRLRPHRLAPLRRLRQRLRAPVDDQPGLPPAPRRRRPHFPPGRRHLHHRAASQRRAPPTQARSSPRPAPRRHRHQPAPRAPRRRRSQPHRPTPTPAVPATP